MRRISFIHLFHVFIFDCSQDPLYEEKKAILAKGGRGEGRGGVNLRFPLMKGRYPSELIDVLRLLLVEKDDLGMQVR